MGFGKFIIRGFNRARNSKNTDPEKEFKKHQLIKHSSKRDQITDPIQDIPLLEALVPDPELGILLQELLIKFEADPEEAE